MNRYLSLAIAVLAMVFLSSPQASVIQSHAPNGATLRAAVDGYYAGPSVGGVRDYVYTTPDGLRGLSAYSVADPTSPSLLTPAIVDPGAPVAPASGVGTIDARAETAFTFGSPIGSGAHDTFSFRSDLTASATSALNSAGEQSSAVVSAVGFIDFFLDPGFAGVAPDSIVATAVLGPMRGLLAYETARVEIVQDGRTLLGSLRATDPGLSVSLLAGHAYQIRFFHMLDVPYGVDPTTTLTISGQLVGVPEPSVLLLVVLGGGLLLVVRGRRQVPFAAA